jgi:trehalose-phosphatase
VRHVFAAWEHILRSVRRARVVVFILDYDGTLVPFHARPEDAKLSPATRRVLAQLAAHRKVRMVLLSGRRRTDLVRCVRVKGAKYLGLYGWEGEAAAALPPETQALLENTRLALARQLRRVRGIRIEHKEHTFAVHHRSAAPGAIRRSLAILQKTLKELAPSLRIAEGEKVWEIVPPQVEDKVVASKLILSAIRRPSLVIYVGDTATDEAAFAALKDGITIRVGRPRRTHARYRLRNPREVRKFLVRLSEALQ